MLTRMVESQYICFIRRMSSIEVRRWLTENEDVFTEIPPSLYETNVDRCVPGRTTVHFFICVLCGLCVVCYLLLMQLHCSKHNQRECTETVWCVESWIFILTKLIRKIYGMVRNAQCFWRVHCLIVPVTHQLPTSIWLETDSMLFIVFFTWGM